MNHSKHIGTISNILASSLDGQSPGLRRKGVELLASSATVAGKDHDRELAYTRRQLELPIQQMLWDILQDTIKPTIGTRDVSRKTTIPEAEPEDQTHEAYETMADEASVQSYGLENMNYSLDGSLLWQQDLAHDDYQNSASCNFDVEPSWQHSSGIRSPPWEDGTPEASESQEKMIYSYTEPYMSYDGYSEPSSQDWKADLSQNMENHMMSDYVYGEEDMFCEYGSGQASPAGQGLIEYEMATGDAFHSIGLNEDVIHGEMEEDMHDHEDIEGSRIY